MIDISNLVGVYLVILLFVTIIIVAILRFDEDGKINNLFARLIFIGLALISLILLLFAYFHEAPATIFPFFIMLIIFHIMFAILTKKIKRGV